MSNQSSKKGKYSEYPLLFRILCRIVLPFTPAYTLSGTEHLPAEPCVIVSNHSQMYGPLAAEFSMPRPHYTWCVGEMMNKKEVPAYAFRDFWSGKPRATHWFYRLLSRLIAPLSVYIFTYAHVIPVYRDQRILTTFRESLSRLQDGADIVIFPEKNEPYNAILCRFQEHFSDLARIYYRKTKNSLAFVPAYIAPNLGRICFGEPIRYRPEAPEQEERERISRELMAAITAMAQALPEHTVVPYQNIPRKQYPLNTDNGAGKSSKT